MALELSHRRRKTLQNTDSGGGGMQARQTLGDCAIMGVGGTYAKSLQEEGVRRRAGEDREG